MPRATSENAIRRDILENIVDKSKWHSKKCLNSQQGGMKKKTEKWKKKKVQTEKKNKMADLCANISIIILSGHDLPPQLKVGDWVGKKHDPTICWLQETHFKYDKDTLKWKDRKRCVMQSLIRS